MKLIQALLNETSNGIFDGKTSIDDERQAAQFERGYEKLAKIVYPNLLIKKGYDPDLRMNLTIGYENPTDLHFRYVEDTGEFFYDRKIFQKILNDPEVGKVAGKHLNVDPVRTFIVYGGNTSKLTA